MLIVFLLAVFVTGLFAVRAVRRTVYWRTHRDEPIRPWMSVRYVSRSYSVPPHILYEAIRLEPIPHDRRPLKEIAREQNRPVDELIRELQEAIKGFRAHAPPPPRPFAPPPQAGATP